MTEQCREPRVAQVATVRYEAGPGAQIPIDVGEKWVVIAGVLRVFLLVAVLGHSRHLFAKAFLNQRWDDWREGIACAFRHCDGVLRTMLGDNAKALVLGRDRATGVVTLHLAAASPNSGLENADRVAEEGLDRDVPPATIESGERAVCFGGAEAEVAKGGPDLFLRVDARREVFRMGVVGAASVLALGQVDSLVDVLSAERLLGGVAMVGATEDSDVGCVAGAAERARVSVIVLEERGRRTSLAVVAHERALAAVSSHDLAARGSADAALLAAVVGLRPQSPRDASLPTACGWGLLASSRRGRSLP